MSIKVDWLSSESNIINLTITGSWTWSEFFTAREQMVDLMEKSDFENIDYILDIKNAPALPENVLSQMRTIGQNHHIKSRHMVVVGANRFIKTMFDIMRTLTPDRMQYITLAQNEEEAVEILNEKYGVSM